VKEMKGEKGRGRREDGRGRDWGIKNDV